MEQGGSIHFSGEETDGEWLSRGLVARQAVDKGPVPPTSACAILAAPQSLNDDPSPSPQSGSLIIRMFIFCGTKY